MDRRRFLTLAATVAALPLLGPFRPRPARAAPLRDIRFRAMHQGKPVGEHSVTFRSDGDRLSVFTNIDITVKVLFFTAFRYKHTAEEIWQSSRLVSVESATYDDGTNLKVSGHSLNDGFRILSGDGPYFTSARLLTTNTLWDAKLIHESSLIDVQNGGEIGLVVKPLGNELVAMSKGHVRADRYQIITPHYAGSLFYDHEGRWVKGLMERQGEILEYVMAN